MTFSILTFLIVCPFVFFAGLVDAIAGGGGIVSMIAYLVAGVPMHFALGTNKFSSSIGTVFSTGRYLKNGFYSKKLVIPTVIASLVGSLIGSNLTIITDEKYLKYMLVIVLPIVALIVLKKKNIINQDNVDITYKKQLLVSSVIAFFLGGYDGFYGPGTGTFMILAFTGIAKINVQEANGNTKCANLASNVAALVTFIINGKVYYSLGIAAAVFSVLGHYIGSGLVIRNGSKVVRPIIILVIVLLFFKVVTGI